MHASEVETTCIATGDQDQGQQDSEHDEGVTTPLLAKSDRLSLKTAMSESARFAIPFALSRVVSAVQNFGNGIIIAKLDIPDAVAASPVMFMLQQGVTGAARGALSTVNVVVGSLNGQMKFEQIGPAVNQGLLLGTLIAIPTAALFFSATDWLHLLGMNSSVAMQAGQYLRAISYGIIPTYWSVVDQQFLLSIKRTRSPIMLNSLFVASSMAIGFPLAASHLGLAGLGYGVSAAAMITFLTGRCHLYFNKIGEVLDRERYNLFCKSFDSGTSFKELLGLSFPTALQATSEWLPTMLIALISASGANAQETLEAEQPSMQMLVMLNQILLGLGTAATVSVANALGRSRACAEQNQPANEIIWKENARTIGYADLVVTALATLPPALFCVLYPDPIVRLFSNDLLSYPLARSMLRLTGATLLADGIRNTATGALLGKKKRTDNFFTSISNLAITSAAATVLGYVSEDALGPLSYFIFRMIAIVITAALLLNRWNQGSRAIEAPSTTFFCCPSRPTNRSALPAPVDLEDPLLGEKNGMTDALDGPTH